MFQRFYFSVFILGSACVFGQQAASVNPAQPTEVVQPASVPKTDTAQVHMPRYWAIEGKNTLTFNQSSYSNWAAGGTSSIGWVAGTNYEFTREKDNTLWENVLVLGYGQTKQQGLGLRKTQDVINFSTSYGYNIGNRWFLSAGAGLITQFSNGYDYDGNNATKSDVFKDGYKRISTFMAPGYVNIGLGFVYKPNDNFTVQLYPANSRTTVVLEPSLQFQGNYGLKQDGDQFLFQLGLLAKVFYQLKLMDNVAFKNNISGFSNYLSHPERIVFNYNGALDMKINKVLTAQLALDLLYDHNQIARMQLRQTLGIGLAYTVSNGVQRSANKYNRNWITQTPY